MPFKKETYDLSRYPETFELYRTFHELENNEKIEIHANSRSEEMSLWGRLTKFRSAHMHQLPGDPMSLTMQLMNIRRLNGEDDEWGIILEYGDEPEYNFKIVEDEEA